MSSLTRIDLMPEWADISGEMVIGNSYMLSVNGGTRDALIAEKSSEPTDATSWKRVANGKSVTWDYNGETIWARSAGSRGPGFRSTLHILEAS